MCVFFCQITLNLLVPLNKCDIYNDRKEYVYIVLMKLFPFFVYTASR